MSDVKYEYPIIIALKEERAYYESLRRTNARRRARLRRQLINLIFDITKLAALVMSVIWLLKYAQ